MADLMLMMERRDRPRSRAIRAMSYAPRLFEHLLAMHIGELSPPAFLANSFYLGWRMLTV